MAHPQQALIDTLNDGDRIDVTWGGSHPRMAAVSSYSGPTLVEAVRGIIKPDDVITAVYRKERPACPHRTLTMHVDGGYICTTHGFAECHQKFQALADVFGVTERRDKLEDVDGDQLQAKVAKLLAELAGYDIEHKDSADFKPDWMREAQQIIDLINAEQGS